MSAPIPGYNPPPEFGGTPGVYRDADLYAGRYASWLSRVGAYLLDSLLGGLVGAIALVPGLVLLLRGSDVDVVTDATGALVDLDVQSVNWLGLALVAVGVALELLFVVWNQILRVGRSGASLGKSALGIRVVRADGAPRVGGWLALARWLLMGLLGGACALNYLWPLWDPQSRTWHDLILDTRVVRA